MIVLLALLFFAPQQTFDSAYRAGLVALGNNDLATAQAQLETASRLQPTNAQVWLALAQTFFKLEKPKLADAAAIKAETLGAADPLVLHGLAFYYAEARAPAKAAELEARYAARAPQDASAYARAIDLYLRAEQPKPAIELARKVVADADSADVRELLGKAYEQDGQVEKALIEFQQAAKLRPFDESFTFDLAQAYLRRQKFSEALNVLQSARERFDKSAQIELATGVALYGLRRFPETIDAFLRTIQLAPELEQPYIFLGRILDQAEGKMPDVTGALATFASLKPDNYMSSFLYAKALGVQHAEPAQVEPLLRKSIALNANYWEAHFELGSVLESKRDYAGAATELEKAADLNPKDATAHYRLARVYDRLGKPAQAASQRALHSKLTEAVK